jgi:hypothetical protein
MSLCLGSQVWPGRAVLVPIPVPEQPHSPPADTHGVDQKFTRIDSARRHFWRAVQAFRAGDKPKFTGHRHCTGTLFAQIT